MFSLKETEAGEKFAVIDQSSIDNLMQYPGDSLAAKARSYLKQFRGTVLPLGSTDKVFMRREAEREYTNPAKGLEQKVYEDKLKAASEVEHLLKSATYAGHRPDNGRHTDAVRGWNYYDLKYVVPNENGKLTVYSAEIQIKLIARGDCFYDITKIKDITNGTAGQAFIKAAGSVYDVSNNSIPDSEQKVKENSEKSLSAYGLDHEVQYSYVGKTEKGKSIYKSNYPINPPKSQKQEDLIALVQNVWSKKPITLRIMKDGVPQKIKVSFDPELSERSDLAKMAFGNKKGTSPEQRITLNLSSDFYQIAEESLYNGSKSETGKDSVAHQNVLEWHYFVTDIVYEEADGTRADCHMNIDVKEKDTGHWFYSFHIKKGAAPQTLDAVVTDESATTPDNSIPDSTENVKSNAEKSLRAYGFSKDSIAEAEKPVVIPIEENQELSERIHTSKRSKYDVIREYLIEKLGGYTFKLSDGRVAIMDKRDANELKYNANRERIAQLGNLRELVERATYKRSVKNVSHPKFIDFHYYTVTAKYNGVEYPLWVNVGVGKNDGKNHIYSLTNNNEEVPTHNGVTRPVGYAIQNTSSANSIPDPTENVKSNAEKSLRAYGFSKDSIAEAEKPVVIPIEENRELSERISTSNGRKYAAIREYLIEKFYGKRFTLSDGKTAIMDKSDAQHLSHLADKNKTAELGNLKEIVESAKLVSETNQVSHPKFNKFWYYAVTVTFENQNYDILINVGQAKNGSGYHIYDITKNHTKRRAANQSPTGLVAGPRTGAIKNNSSTNSIPDPEQNVKSNAEKSLRAYGFSKELTEEEKHNEVENSFKKYSERQIENWKNSKSIVLYESDEQFRKLIQKAVVDKQYNKKIYFGAVDAPLAQRIKDAIGVDVTNYTCSLSTQEIRKILKDHGNEEKEALRGQTAVDEDDIVELPGVIQFPESVKKSPDTYNGKPAVIFVKNRMTVVGVVSDKHMDLFIQTAYSHKKREPFPRRQMNKPLSIRPKRVVVQIPISVYPIPSKMSSQMLKKVCARIAFRKNAQET